MSPDASALNAAINIASVLVEIATSDLEYWVEGDEICVCARNSSRADAFRVGIYDFNIKRARVHILNANDEVCR